MVQARAWLGFSPALAPETGTLGDERNQRARVIGGEEVKDVPEFFFFKWFLGLLPKARTGDLVRLGMSWVCFETGVLDWFLGWL